MLAVVERASALVDLNDAFSWGRSGRPDWSLSRRLLVLRFDFCFLSAFALGFWIFKSLRSGLAARASAFLSATKPCIPALDAIV